MKEIIIDRFVKLVTVDTEANPKSESRPSTKKQTEFLKNVLIPECEKIGLKEIKMHGDIYLTAVLPSNIQEETKTIGFLAHVDTSPAFSGANVKPNIINNYDGEDIKLPSGLITKVEEFSFLKKCKGKTIITSDGNTLLGADDKAGVTEILTAMEFLVNNPEIKHGKIVVAFTTDEEIGCGADGFDVKDFGADFAFTVDGGNIGELEWESFNAAVAKIKINGKSVHPGSSKNIMVNAVLIGSEFIEMLPKNETPATTEAREGFYHIDEISGDVVVCNMEVLIREHDNILFKKRKEFISDVVRKLNDKYNNRIELEIKDQYFNMGEVIKDNMYIVEKAEKAFIEAGVKVESIPIRGGTDGSRLSFMGLPCPNIFTGGYNYHGPYELAVVEYMEKAVTVIVNICKA